MQLLSAVPLTGGFFAIFLLFSDLLFEIVIAFYLFIQSVTRITSSWQLIMGIDSISQGCLIKNKIDNNNIAFICRNDCYV